MHLNKVSPLFSSLSLSLPPSLSLSLQLFLRVGVIMHIQLLCTCVCLYVYARDVYVCAHITVRMCVRVCMCVFCLSCSVQVKRLMASGDVVMVPYEITFHTNMAIEEMAYPDPYTLSVSHVRTRILRVFVYMRIYAFRDTLRFLHVYMTVHRIMFLSHVRTVT